MSWASFHVLEVMSSSKHLQKRIGYLAAAQSFRAETEVLMLATNLLKKVNVIDQSHVDLNLTDDLGYSFIVHRESIITARNITAHCYPVARHVASERSPAPTLAFKCSCSQEIDCCALQVCLGVSRDT